MQGMRRRPDATLLLLLALFGVLSYLSTTESDPTEATIDDDVHRALHLSLSQRYGQRYGRVRRKAATFGGFSPPAGGFVRGNVLVDGNGDALLGGDDPVGVGRRRDWEGGRFGDDAGDGEDACGAPRSLPRPIGVRMFPPLTVKWGGKFSTHERIERYEGCLQYDCAAHDAAHCQDPFAATEYDGPHPPCCHHILRDMLEAFDRAMCGLGLQYAAAYGTLLGLVRDDHVIPWTGDNDFVVDFATARAMWDERAHLEANYGLRLMHDFFFRTCLTENFAGGALAKWTTKKYAPLLNLGRGKYIDYFPYADVFYGEVHPGLSRFVTERGCGYDVAKYFPLRRMAVYGGAFRVSVPSNVEELLEADYGKDWGVPPKDRKRHGCNELTCKPKCEGYDPTFKRKWSRNTYDNKWIARWNSILMENYTDPSQG